MVSRKLIQTPSITHLNYTYCISDAVLVRSSWIPGASTPTASEQRSPFVRPWKKKVGQESGVTTSALDDIGTSTTLESHKSLQCYAMPTSDGVRVC